MGKKYIETNSIHVWDTTTVYTWEWIAHRMHCSRYVIQHLRLVHTVRFSKRAMRWCVNAIYCFCSHGAVLFACHLLYQSMVCISNRKPQSYRMGVKPICMQCHILPCIPRKQNHTIWTLSLIPTQSIFYIAVVHKKIVPCERAFTYIQSFRFNRIFTHTSL